MKIAPIDIAHKTFKKKTFGSDTDEVMEFLRQVADELESVLRERNSLKEQLREREMQILEYRERDKTLRDTITTAQKMAEKIRDDAEREAKLITNDANQKAEIIVRDARDSLKRVYQEVTDIKRAKVQFENQFKAILNSHLQMLDTAEPLSASSSERSSKVSEEARSTAVSPVSS